MKVIYIFISLVVGFILFFKFLNWKTAQSYNPSRDEVEDKLSRVLNGTMSWEEWDDFVCIPITHDDELEIIRNQCAEMTGNEFYDCENIEEQKVWIFNDQGLVKVRELLVKLGKTHTLAQHGFTH